MSRQTKIFVIDDFKNNTNWYAYYADFYNYKIFGDIIPYFGRDALLDTPTLSHIHIAKSEDLKLKWKKIRNVYDRKNTIGKPEDDYWLIYAHDKNNNEYLLLNIIGPNAHDRDKWTSYYNNLYTNIVTPWMNGQIVYLEPDDSEDI